MTDSTDRPTPEAPTACCADLAEQLAASNARLLRAFANALYFPCLLLAVLMIVAAAATESPAPLLVGGPVFLVLLLSAMSLHSSSAVAAPVADKTTAPTPAPLLRHHP